MHCVVTVPIPTACPRALYTGRKDFLMLTITDYAGGIETVHGPYTEIRFRCLNQSVPACNDPTVTYSVVTTGGDWQHLTVSLVHVISPAQDERK